MLQKILIAALVIECVIYALIARALLADSVSIIYIVLRVLLIAVVIRVFFVLPSYFVAGVMRARANNPQPLRSSLSAFAKEIDARAVAFSISQLLHQWLVRDPKKTAVQAYLASEDAAPAKPVADPVADSSANVRDDSIEKKSTETNNDHDLIPILLVHGYVSNRGMFWRLKKALDAANIGPVYGVDIEPLFGSIDRMVPALAACIEQIRSETGAAQIIIVAHSMGGLITRRYMANMQSSAAIKRFICIASPHGGTKIASYGFGVCVDEMRTDSAWLAELRRAEEGISMPPTLSIYTLNDDLVYPPESSKLDWPDCENLPFTGVGHVSLLFSKPVAERVIAEIKKTTSELKNNKP